MDIQIYKAEKADGLQELILNNKISIASTIEDSKENPESLVRLPKISLALASANYNQKDLFYKKAILASVGWNANDDVFEAVDTWNARNTVEDKQLNLSHDEMRIVGHMTKSYVVDYKGDVVDDNTSAEDIPAKFDIVNEFVLYKIWKDEERQQEISSLIQEIENGEWCVSMECYFPAFDYALINSVGEQRTVTRNEQSSFLTKHLRSYGGTGEFQGYKVGRILRGLFFSGQGIVKNPANKRSIIFNVNDVKPFKSQGSLVVRDKKMDLEQKVAELEGKLIAKDAELVAAKSAETSKTIADLRSEVETLKTSVATLTSEKAIVVASAASKDETISQLTVEATAANTKLAEVEAKVVASEKAAVKVARCGQLATAGVVEGELEATYAQWGELPEVQFNAIVTMIAAKAAVKVEAKVIETPILEESKVDDKPNLAVANEQAASRIADLGKALLESGALRFSAKAQKNLSK